MGMFPRACRVGRLIGCVLLAAVIFIGLHGTASAEFSGANGPIAYAKNGSIWRIADLGAKPKRITSDADQPALSPNGRSVTWVRGDDIWVSNVNGNHETQLTETADFVENGPNFAANNRDIIYDGPPSAGPCCIDLWIHYIGLGSEPFTGDNAVDQGPAVSPDRKHIVWVRNSRIYTMTAEGTNVREVTPQLSAYAPQYSPSGKRIIYGAGEICSIKQSGKKRKRLTGPHEFVDSSPVYSPDGKHILFERRADAQRKNGIYMAMRTGRTNTL